MNFFIAFSLHLLMQNTLVTINDFNAITRLETIITIADTSGKVILTDKALNNYIADKIASYLAKEGDLTLFKNYVLADIDDKILFFGRNFDLRTNKDNRLTNILTTGLKAKADDDFAELFSKNDFSDKIGLDIKFTCLFKGSVWFDNKKQEQKNKSLHVVATQQQKMVAKRKLIFNTQKVELINKINAFNVATRFISDAAYAELRSEFIDENNKKIIPNFTKKETEVFDDDENSHNAVRISWISISAYAPFTNTSYSVADSFTTAFDEKKFHPWEGNVIYTYVWESKRYGKFFFSANVGGYLNNTVKNEDIDKIDLNKYKQLGGTDTISIAQLSSDKAFVGQYKTFFTARFKGQVVYFLHGLDWIGLSLTGEQLAGDYNPLNFQLGFPMVFEGKDKDAKVNIELQLKAFDVNNTIKPDKDFGDKFSIGLSVALPFSSIIY